MSSGDQGLSCSACLRALPIRAPRRGEQAASWVCDDCQVPATGIVIPGLVGMLGERVRLAPEHFDAQSAEPIPTGLRDLVDKFLIRRRLRQESHEQRRNPRVPCDLDAVVVGLNEHWMPSRDPIRAIVIDLAAYGLGMMTAQCVHDQWLAVQIECSAGLVQVIGRRAWSNFVGDSFQNTGVEFMARLGRTALRAEEP
jgi:hypothetical protein